MIYKTTLYKTNGINKGNGIYKGVDALPPVAAMTLRFKFSDLTYSPIVAGVGTGGTWQQVKADPNIWDWTNTNSSWVNRFGGAFTDINNLVQIIDAGDTSSLSSIGYCFDGCSSLVGICQFDTSSVTTMARCFRNTAIKKIPLFRTESVIDCSIAFSGCTKVESGALALYQQMSTQATPPSTTTNCFSNCGQDTTTGAAELAQIPASWGGTAP